jgi:hypothetical protein
VRRGVLRSSTSGMPPFYGLSAVPPTTPLPAALPLFATGLGALGLLGWRRKRKARVSLLGAEPLLGVALRVALHDADPLPDQASITTRQATHYRKRIYAGRHTVLPYMLRPRRSQTKISI